MEGGREVCVCGRNEIKGKNSEITELFIFPALIVWAFEASTLMYLDVLGVCCQRPPQPLSSGPAPRRHVGSISSSCPSSAALGVF
jgi:hypothetical protein